MAKYNTDLQQNNTELDEILQTVNNLPEAGGPPPVIQPIKITKNGTTTAPVGVDGYSPIEVAVPSDKKPEQEKTISVTNNGAAVVTPDNGKVLSKATVNVNVPKQKPEETKSVKYTTNGKRTVTPTAGKVMTAVNVEVAVPTPAPVIQSKTITANGTYTAPSGVDGFSPVTVNCPVPKAEQEKSVTIKANGTSSVVPDNGKVLKKVNVTVQTPAPKPEQTKTVEISENGDVTITPDVGKVLSEVIAKINVAGSGGGGVTRFGNYEFVYGSITLAEAATADIVVTHEPIGISGYRLRDILFLYAPHADTDASGAGINALYAALGGHNKNDISMAFLGYFMPNQTPQTQTYGNITSTYAQWFKIHSDAYPKMIPGVQYAWVHLAEVAK